MDNLDFCSLFCALSFEFESAGVHCTWPLSETGISLCKPPHLICKLGPSWKVFCPGSGLLLLQLDYTLQASFVLIMLLWRHVVTEGRLQMLFGASW